MGVYIKSTRKWGELLFDSEKPFILKNHFNARHWYPDKALPEAEKNISRLSLNPNRQYLPPGQCTPRRAW